MKFLPWKKKNPAGIDLKNRILKQKEPMLDALSEAIKGARLCPVLVGQKCIGNLCEFFQKYENVPDKKGKIQEYWRCNYNQTPALLVELLVETRKQTRCLAVLVDIFLAAGKDKKEPD